jgi:outer membrane protein assembly factor BamD (BamD/ComL family)
LYNLGLTHFEVGQTEKAKDYFEKVHVIFKEFLGTEHSDTKKVNERLETCTK